MQHSSIGKNGVGNYIVYNKEYVYARILFTNEMNQHLIRMLLSVNSFYR